MEEIERERETDRKKKHSQHNLAKDFRVCHLDDANVITFAQHQLSLSELSSLRRHIE